MSGHDQDELQDAKEENSDSKYWEEERNLHIKKVSVEESTAKLGLCRLPAA